MKQKVGIVAAFMHDPDIHILDEPTGGLDPLMQNTFVKLINEEKEKGKTILMSSHSFSEVDRTSDRVGIIKDGKLVAIEKIRKLQSMQRKVFNVTMNKSLFNTMLKNKLKTIVSFTLGSIFYLSLVIWIFPSIAESQGLNKMLESLPEGFMSAFGFSGGISNMSSFVAGEYYGLLFIIILLINCVSTTTQLIARLVDQGSMAYLLSGGLSRVKIALIQIAVILLSLFIIISITTVSGVIGADIFIEKNNFNARNFIELNIVTFLLFFVISGYCFLFSCLFNDEKRAIAISGGLSFTFFAIDMVSKISEKLDWMQYLTIFSTFESTDIANGQADIIPISIGMGLTGVLFYTLLL